MIKDFEIETSLCKYVLNYMISFLRGQITTHTMDEARARAFIEFLATLYYDYRPYGILAKGNFDFLKITKDNEEILDFLVDAGIQFRMTFGEEYQKEVADKYISGLKSVFCGANKGIVGEENTKMFSSQDTLNSIHSRITASSIIAFIIVLQCIPADIFNGILEFADIKPEKPKQEG